jgi:hypothetical protein
LEEGEWGKEECGKLKGKWGRGEGGRGSVKGKRKEVREREGGR